MTLIKKMKSAYSDYNTGNYAAIGCAVGVVAGAAAGLVLPPYIGWKAAACIAKAAEFSPFISASAKILGAIGLSTVTYPLTLTVGALGGAAVGGAAGAGIGKIKDTLESLISKD